MATKLRALQKWVEKAPPFFAFPIKPPHSPRLDTIKEDEELEETNEAIQP